MKQNIVETILGAVVLLIAIGFMTFSLNTAQVQAPDGYAVTASFTDIGSLNIGDDVKISGVIVGQIKDVALDPQTYQAVLTLVLAQDTDIPEDSAAIVTSTGLLGGNYLSLSPGASDIYLAEGDHIDYTQDAQNLETLLGKFIFSLSDNDAKKE